MPQTAAFASWSFGARDKGDMCRSSTFTAVCWCSVEHSKLVRVAAQNKIYQQTGTKRINIWKNHKFWTGDRQNVKLVCSPFLGLKQNLIQSNAILFLWHCHFKSEYISKSKSYIVKISVLNQNYIIRIRIQDLDDIHFLPRINTYSSQALEHLVT